jgi:ABC-type multidrug transport system ATPase subunit
MGPSGAGKTKHFSAIFSPGIMGPSGAGKTTLLNALTFNLGAGMLSQGDMSVGSVDFTTGNLKEMTVRIKICEMIRSTVHTMR